MATHALIGKDHPTIYESDLHHCCCCIPPSRTLTRDVREGFGAGWPEFYCPKTGISYRMSEGAETYIAGRNRAVGRNGEIVTGA